MHGPFLEPAAVIGRQVCEHAARAKDGSIYWRGPAQLRGQIVAAPLGPHLYPGTAGITIFLAALERTFGEGHYGELCRQGIAPLRRELAGIMAEPARAEDVRHNIGGLSGLSSLFYALVRIGDLLEDPEFYRDALDLSTLITPKRISEDDNPDVMLGSAGAILALLALDDRMSVRNARGMTPLELASACARNLMSKQISHRGQRRVWARASRPSVAGFCHGAAGMCCALLRLFARTGQAELKEAALEGMAFERSLFDPERRDWSFTPGLERRFVNSWCKGAPGILLGRIGALDVCDDFQVREEIRAAVEITRSPELNEVDDVCCGNMGRVDALLHAHGKLSDPDLLAAARELASRVLQRARGRGQLSFHEKFYNIFDPRLFIGVSGVGYVLLRLARPGTLPCVLAME